MPETATFYPSPIGTILIQSTGEFISGLLFINEDELQKVEDKLSITPSDNDVLLHKCRQQLSEYFEGTRRTFDLPLQQNGTGFQQKVWWALTQIPFGQTINYMELSKRTGNTKAIRAVGTTNGKNQLSIVVPCHRVIGSNGTLTGYSGGLWRKQWLLEHEAKIAHGLQMLF